MHTTLSVTETRSPLNFELWSRLRSFVKDKVFPCCGNKLPLYLSQKTRGPFQGQRTSMGATGKPLLVESSNLVSIIYNKHKYTHAVHQLKQCILMIFCLPLCVSFDITLTHTHTHTPRSPGEKHTSSAQIWR